MKLRRKLIALVDVLAGEAERNEDFRTRLDKRARASVGAGSNDWKG